MIVNFSNRITRMPTAIFFLAAMAFFTYSTSVFAETTEPNEQAEFFEMSIEDLMNIEITLASRKQQKLFKTPAAVYVITNEDIRRSGASTIPDLLRMVPGMEVARINSNKWAITSRGFNQEFAKRLLVMIDGRSIYGPLFGGVRWDTHDVMLEDIDRIEVIRGPGGTLWGSNAVNGIINIVTKNAKDTQGTILVGQGSDIEHYLTAARYGGKLKGPTYFRVYSRYFDRDDTTCIDHAHTAHAYSNDGWDVLRGGFRIDSYPQEHDHLTLLGDIYNGDIGEATMLYSLTSPISQESSHDNKIEGGNLLGRWERTLSKDSDMKLQVYYNRDKRLEKKFNETIDTYDIDFQHRFPMTEQHELSWGLGYRLDRHTVDGTFNYSLSPRHRDLSIYSGFIQDNITVLKDKLEVTIGTKIEHNYYTGLEWQPSGRFIWTLDDRNAIWGAVTRAVRTPNRHDTDSTTSWGVFQVGPSVISQEAYGNEDVDSEKVIVYELGYRARPTEKMFIDVTGFINRYDNLMATERTANIPKAGYTIWPNQQDNKLYGETYGVELSASYQAAKNWNLSAGYTFLQMQLRTRSSSTSTRDATVEGKSPHNQFHFRSYLNLTDNLELDCSLKYVDNLPADNILNYIRFDLRLGWHITKNMELSLVGQNLFDNRHSEFGEEQGQSVTEAERAFFAKLTYSF